MARFDARTAVVTGGAGEIGRATALRLASEGAQVLVVSRNPSGIEQTVEAIRQAGGTAEGFVADVTDPADVAAYAAAGARLGGHIDLVFNNAGIEGPVVPIEDFSAEAFDEVMAVNVRGVFLGLKHTIPYLRSGSAVVNCASVAGVKGYASSVAYVASKHAVIGITRTAALELAPRNIRVNAVCPGPIESQMMSRIEAGMDVEDAHAVMLGAQPLGRFGTLDEVAATVAFLLSDEAAFSVGAALVVDGGKTVL